MRNLKINVKICKILEILTYFGPFRSYLSNEYNGAVSVILPQPTRTIGSMS